VAGALHAHGARTLFTLCGGHIAPVVVAGRQQGLRVIDTRSEAAAVFAADAEARLTGVPGVAMVTAGPGVTNTITALENARLAGSPLVLLCGATATFLRGRGALQDIDQESTLLPHVKWFAAARRVRDLVPLVGEAFARARAEVPGPVCVECPVDLLYPETVVRAWYGLAADRPPVQGLAARAQRAYLRWHVGRLFAGAAGDRDGSPPASTVARDRRFVPAPADVGRLARRLKGADRPVLVVGSQAVGVPGEVDRLAAAVGELGLPVYLSGMARGLLGGDHACQVRHRRKEALRDADLVILAGVSCDFRLDYGRHISRRATLVTLNRSARELRLNRRPTQGIQADPDLVIRQLATTLAGNRPNPGRGGRWAAWLGALRQRDAAREADIDAGASQASDRVNPLALLRAVDAVLPDTALLVADGGDFVATASYVIRPRRPLSWLDPGVFGTLGVGGGFVLGAHAARPGAELWLLWGDGAAGFGLAEIDTFVRHDVAVIALVGNDASWAQIAREQVPILGDATGTELRRSDYHRVAEGFGGKGLLIERDSDTADVLREARRLAHAGHPVLINALLGMTDFRKGSVSI
jgi:acetolactate synthase-1/2/3 large subunit